MIKDITSNKRTRIYTVLITLTFLFHVFNNLQINESLKIFHLFAAAAIGAGFILSKRASLQTVNVFKMLIAWTAFSSLLSPVESFSMSFIKFLIVVTSVMFITRIPMKGLVYTINCIIPLVLVILYRHYFSEPVYRYQGFYEDPNYFCTTLLALYFYIQLLWIESKRMWIRAALVVEILLIALLVSFSISRTGMACMIVMTLIFFSDVFRKHKVLAVLGGVLFAVVLLGFWGDYVQRAIEGYTVRETENSDTMSSAASLRWEISMRGISYIFSHPLYLLQGIGFGTYSEAGVLEGWHANTSHIDHNTITSCLSEQGLVGFTLLARFFYLLFVRIVRNEYLGQVGIKITCLCTLGVFFMFSTSINQSTYLPFWFIVFTLVSLAEAKPICGIDKKN